MLLYRVVITLSVLACTSWEYFPACGAFIMLYRVVPTFEPVDGTLLREVVITSVLDEDPPCLVEAGLYETPPI